MAQLKKVDNTMSDHPELKKLLESVNLEDLFEEEKSTKNKENKSDN